MPRKVTTFHFFLIGSARVGKSAIIQQIRQHAFINEQQPTQYSSSFKTKLSGYHVTFCDTSGSDTFDTIRLMIPPGPCALVFVYDITNKQSFQAAERLISAFRGSGRGNPLVLLGNKIDKEGNRNVQKDIVKRYHPQVHIVEASATTYEQATAPFVGLLRNEAFMQQLQQLDNPTHARAGWLRTLFLWLQRHFFKKNKVSVDRIEPANTLSPTVDGSEPQCSTLDPTQPTHGIRPPTMQKIHPSINPATELGPSAPCLEDVVGDQSDQERRCLIAYRRAGGQNVKYVSRYWFACRLCDHPLEFLTSHSTWTEGDNNHHEFCEDFLAKGWLQNQQLHHLHNVTTGHAP